MTTGTDLAVRDDQAPALHLPSLPSLPDVDSWIHAMAAVADLAERICNTPFVPAGLRGNPAGVTATFLTGRELGMGPMQSLRNIHMIQGVPSLRAEYKRAKILAAGHEFRVMEWDAKHCKVAGRRRGDRGEPTVVEYTMADAERAGLVKRNPNYRDNPMAMLMARASTLLGNAIFADVTNGLATTELLDDPDVMAGAVGAALELPAPPKPEVASLRQRAAAQTVKAEVVEPEADGGLAYGELLEYVSAKLAELGVQDKDGKLRVVSKIAGRPLATAADLTPDEARKTADTLEGLDDGTALAALLDDIALSGDPREEGEAGE